MTLANRHPYTASTRAVRRYGATERSNDSLNDHDIGFTSGQQRERPTDDFEVDAIGDPEKDRRREWHAGHFAVVYGPLSPGNDDRGDSHRHPFDSGNQPPFPRQHHQPGQAAEAEDVK